MAVRSRRARFPAAQRSPIEAGIRAYGAAFDELVTLTFAIAGAQTDLYQARDIANIELHAVINAKARRAGQLYSAAIWSVFGTITVALLLGGLLARSIVGPVQQVQAAAERIAEGETETTLDVSAHGELGKLAAALDQVRLHVAERKQAEVAASEARQFAETVLAHVQTGVIVYDTDLRFRLWNSAVETLTGMTSADAVGRSTSEVFPMFDTKAYHAYLERARGGETVQYRNLRMPDPSSDQVYWLEGSMTAFRAPDGTVKGVVATVNDVTERHRQMQALRAAKQDAEVAVRAKGEFVAMVSHELRTPLNGIVGMANLMSTTELDEEQHDYLDIINQCSDHLLELIGQVLDFSHIGSGHFRLNVAPYAPRETLKEVIRIVQPQSEEKNLAIALYLDRTVPSSVLGDRRYVRQVLMNLLSNAVKFTESGSIHVRMYQLPQGTLCFAVEDTGIGIPEDKYHVVFDPFSQADASMSRAYEGTGLGLSISQQLAEQMGGRLYFESREGVGSTFYFEVPLQPAVAAVTTAAA